jgi:hypothetical protein
MSFQEVESSEYQQELIDALKETSGKPIYFYDVAEDIMLEHPNKEIEYDPFPGSGSPSYVVSTKKLTRAQKKALALKYSPPEAEDEEES